MHEGTSAEWIVGQAETSVRTDAFLGQILFEKVYI
jgi:hypothetical protein